MTYFKIINNITMDKAKAKSKDQASALYMLNYLFPFSVLHQTTQLEVELASRLVVVVFCEWQWGISVVNTTVVAKELLNLVVNSYEYFGYRDFTRTYFTALTAVGTCVHHVNHSGQVEEWSSRCVSSRNPFRTFGFKTAVVTET